MFTFRGVAPPAVVPFEKNGEIDWKSYRELLDWWMDKEVDAIVAGGSTGEVNYLTDEERLKVIETTVDHVSGEVPVVAGTGCPSTGHTLQLTAAAKEAGARAALVITPYYYPLSQEEMEGHFREVAKEVGLPVILYHVPKFTHVEFSPRTVERLSSLSQIIGIKESSGDLGSIQKTIYLTGGEDFGVICGSGNLLSNVLGSGGVGGILALANLVPEKCGEIFNLHMEGEREKARQLNFRLMELNRLITSKFGIPGLKAGLEMRGLPSGYPRSPMGEISGKEREEVRRELGEVVEI